MSSDENNTLSLKVMINKEKTKVLFAEAGSDFVDVLLSFLTLPLGKIAKVLENHYGDQAPAVGSISTLYRSLANLDNECFVNEAAKLMLLNPRSSLGDVCPNLKFDISDTLPTEYFICNNLHCPCNSNAKYVSMYYGGGSCTCLGKGTMSIKVTTSDLPAAESSAFTINAASFVICDDLQVVPYSKGFLQTLRNFGISDTNGAQLMNVTFGIDEIIALLKFSLVSETPLTDLILNNKPSSASKQIKSGLLSHQIEKNADFNSKNIILKITVHKSTKELVFAHAEDDFVELLFSFLTIPLGGVESLLKNNTCLKNIDNLYRSLADVIDDQNFETPITKNRLMNPKLPPHYTSINQFLPLIEESVPKLFYNEEKLYYNCKSNFNLVKQVKSPKGLGNYVKKPATYMVTDDLTVTPFSMTTGLTILDRLNIALCDVDELEVNIGLEEALGILQASLTTASALSTGLMNHIFKKQVKQDFSRPNLWKCLNRIVRNFVVSVDVYLSKLRSSLNFKGPDLGLIDLIFKIFKRLIEPIEPTDL